MTTTSKIIIGLAVLLLVSFGAYSLISSPSGSPETSPTVSSDPNASSTPVTIPEDLPDVVSASVITARGTIELELYPKVAPITVLNFITLAKSGFYNTTKFHRVVPDFVIQGGDPLSKTDDPRVGSGGPGYQFKDEMNPKVLGLSPEAIKQLEAQGYQYDYNLKSLPVTVGTIAMANSGPDTNGSQFFIVTTQDQPYLNGKHTVFGKVTKGMDVVRAVKQGDAISNIIIK